MVSDDVEKRAIVAHNYRTSGVAEPQSVHGNGVKDLLRIGGRVADDPEDLGRRGLLVKGLAQGTLKFRPRRRRVTFGGELERRAALVAELRGSTVLVLAAGTRHAGNLPAAGSAKGRNVGRD